MPSCHLPFTTGRERIPSSEGEPTNQGRVQHNMGPLPPEEFLGSLAKLFEATRTKGSLYITLKRGERVSGFVLGRVFEVSSSLSKGQCCFQEEGLSKWGTGSLSWCCKV